MSYTQTSSYTHKQNFTQIQKIRKCSRPENYSQELRNNSRKSKTNFPQFVTVLFTSFGFVHNLLGTSTVKPEVQVARARENFWDESQQMLYILKCTDRKVTPVKGVNNKSFVSYMNDTANAVARVECCCSTWIVLNGSVVVTVFDILKQIKVLFV